MGIRRNVVFVALAGSFLALCSRVNAAGDFSFPAADFGDKQAFWGAVMTHFYGPYDAARQCWSASILGYDYCMRPHRLDEATEGDRRRIFLVTGGPGAEAQECYTCTGSMGLIVLEERRGNLVMTAVNDLVEETGLWGVIEPVEAFRIQTISPAGSGWTVESDWSGHGVTIGGQTIYGIVGSEVRELGYIPTYGTDCDAGNTPCNSYRFNLGFIRTAGPFYDVELVLAADSDRPQGPDRYRIRFDAESMEYDVPDAVKELLFR